MIIWFQLLLKRRKTMGIKNIISDLKNHPASFLGGAAISLGAVFMVAVLGKEVLQIASEYPEAKQAAELLGTKIATSKSLLTAGAIAASAVPLMLITEAGRQLAKYGEIPLLKGMGETKAVLDRKKRLGIL